VSEKEYTNDNGESFAIGNVAKGDSILATLVKHRHYHNIAEVVNDFYEYEMR
jgi:hypothetical protein